MTLDYESENLVLRLWYIMHHVHNLLKVCEDRVIPEYGLTTEHCVVLITIKYGHKKPADIARWLARSPNSVSMIVDRMVKAGLVRRVRDRRDRRVVNLIITGKGEDALKPAHAAGWKLLRQVLSPLSDEDKQTLLRLLMTIQNEANKYLDPEVDIEETTRNEAERHADLYGWLVHYCSPYIAEGGIRAVRS
jgi:DNA-binding MarR family transcriptional regulator